MSRASRVSHHCPTAPVCLSACLPSYHACGLDGCPVACSLIKSCININIFAPHYVVLAAAHASPRPQTTPGHYEFDPVGHAVAQGGGGLLGSAAYRAA